MPGETVMKATLITALLLGILGAHLAFATLDASRAPDGILPGDLLDKQNCRYFEQQCRRKGGQDCANRCGTIAADKRFAWPDLANPQVLAGK